MPIYVKANKHTKNNIAWFKVAMDANTGYTEVLYQCKGKCFNFKNPDDSLTLHTKVVMPSGSEYYTCNTCGAMVIFKNEGDRIISEMPDELKPNLKSIEREQRKKARDAINKQREVMRK